MATLLRATLEAPADELPALQRFYSRDLGLPESDTGFRLGSSELSFTPGAGAPFYHYAVLVPGNRFDAAHAWAQERVEVLPIGNSDETVIHFENWRADACYFHDPAGNIVELIAHAGVGESSTEGEFSVAEFLQLSEIGVVGDKRVLVPALVSLGLEVAHDDTGDDDLIFVGPPTSSVIISPVGRGWLPQDRPAEVWPVELTLRGDRDREVVINGHLIRVQS